MTTDPKNKAATIPSPGELLKEIRKGSAAQQREILQQLNRSQPGLGIDGAVRLLQFLEDRVPCLDETQRVALLTGHRLEAINAPEAVQLRDRLQTWWLKAEDRESVATVIQLLLTHGCLPSQSTKLLKSVRKAVDLELLRQKLPRLQTLAWAEEVVKRRALESGIEIDLDAEAAAVANAALKKYRQAVADADDLVFGELTVGEARTWLTCSRAVRNGKAGQAFRLNGMPMSTLHYEQQVNRLFNSCRRWGVEGPDALEKAMNQKLQRWNGNPSELVQDKSGQWRWGDGSPADKEAVVAYRSVMKDAGDGFGPRPGTEPLESTGFTRRGEGYAGLFRDRDMFQIMREIERAETATTQMREQSQPQNPSNG